MTSVNGLNGYNPALYGYTPSQLQPREDEALKASAIAGAKVGEAAMPHTEANAFNTDYETMAKELATVQGRGINPFGAPEMGVSNPHIATVQGRQEGLDSEMLAQKRAGFEVGLGGTNNPIDPATGLPCKLNAIG